MDLVSIWAFDKSYTKMTCVHNFDANDQICLTDVELFKHKYPKYFAKIISDIHVLADDVSSHASTKELIEDYFKVYDIKSLLDYIIYTDNQPRAVICCETVANHRQWTEDDLNYLRMATVLASTRLDFASMNLTG